jgi:hypothetical protein
VLSDNNFISQFLNFGEFCSIASGNWEYKSYYFKKMAHGEIHILPSGSTPEFHFSCDGVLKFRGRGLYKSKEEVNEKVHVWINEYLKHPSDVTYVELSFEYLNSYSTIVLVSILRRLAEVILVSKKLIIQWYYEEDDEDMFERGEYISQTFKIPFKFIPVLQIADFSQLA